MTLGALVIIVVLCAATCLVFALAYRQDKPKDLRGDWWVRFEREFRAYATRQGAPTAHDRRRRNRRPHAG